MKQAGEIISKLSDKGYRLTPQRMMILAAIEKGTPLSELKPPPKTGPNWIKNLTAGIALLIISVPFCVGGFFALEEWFDAALLGKPFHAVLPPLPLALGIILFALGISRIIRGLLQKKYPPEAQSLQENNEPAD